jgi:hypothetical protein
MNPAADVPADTRIMGIVHAALQRDLARVADALSRRPPPGDAQRIAIARHVAAMMVFLHEHHHGEDAWLWPTMRRLAPAASDLLDQMDADHLAIAADLEAVSLASADYAKSAAGRQALADALGDLRVSLDPHLRREEDEMMPIVAATLTAAQWDAWEHEYYVKPKSKKDLGLEGHWLIDGRDRAVYDHVVGKVNPVLRLVLVRVFGPTYRKACATRWGPDVPVGPKLDQKPLLPPDETMGSARRPWRTGGEVTLHIDAPPERLYDLVADVGSTPTRSHEVQGCDWISGAPATVGSRFRGSNRSGLIRWSRVCEVVSATTGEDFAFRTVPERWDITRGDSFLWGYHFEPEGTGTRVTHCYSVVKPPAPWLLAVYGMLMPHHRDARPALRHTLQKLQVAAESATRAGQPTSP